MVDREVFDEWLRERARCSGALRVDGMFTRLERDANADAIVHFEQKDGGFRQVRTRLVLSADGARSEVAR